MDSDELITSEIDKTLPDSRQDWENLRDSTIFITGGTGFFGRWITEALSRADKKLNLNLRVILLTRDPVATMERFPFLHDNKRFELLPGDIRNFRAPEGRIDYVIHGAAPSAAETFAGETALNKFLTLSEGTRQLLEVVAGKGVKRLLFLSSGVVYGPLEAGMQLVPEKWASAPDPLAPQMGLAEGKRAAEFLCAEYARMAGFDLKIARCFSFAGPGLPLNLHYAFGSFIRQAIDSPEIVIEGDGRAVRSYLYMGDLIQWLIRMLATNGEAQVAFNIGSDAAISIRNLAIQIQMALAPKKKVVIKGNSDPSVGNPFREVYVPSVERFRKTYGLSRQIELGECIRLTAAYELALRRV